MAKIFLDANVFIDIVEERKNIRIEDLQGNDVLLSPLSIHILSYLYKYRMPDQDLKEFLNSNFTLIELDTQLADAALLGPTNDFEDNVQLHSSAQADCDLFLTGDKDLLAMKFFGKARIMSPEEL